MILLLNASLTSFTALFCFLGHLSFTSATGLCYLLFLKCSYRYQHQVSSWCLLKYHLISEVSLVIQPNLTPLLSPNPALLLYFPHCSHVQLNMFIYSVVYCCIFSPCMYHQLTTPSLIKTCSRKKTNNKKKTCSRRSGPLPVLFTTIYLRVKVAVWHMIRPSIHIYGMSQSFSIQNQRLFLKSTSTPSYQKQKSNSVLLNTLLDTTQNIPLVHAFQL